jgi:hypothetical protein
MLCDCFAFGRNRIEFCFQYIRWERLHCNILKILNTTSRWPKQWNSQLNTKHKSVRLCCLLISLHFFFAKRFVYTSDSALLWAICLLDYYEESDSFSMSFFVGYFYVWHTWLIIVGVRSCYEYMDKFSKTMFSNAVALIPYAHSILLFRAFLFIEGTSAALLQ